MAMRALEVEVYEYENTLLTTEVTSSFLKSLIIISREKIHHHVF